MVSSPLFFLFHPKSAFAFKTILRLLYNIPMQKAIGKRHKSQ